MTEAKTCPKCQAALPANAPSGICPKCLMHAGLELALELREDAGDGNPAATTPEPTGFIPPEPSLLAPYFPHLEISELLGHGGMGAVYKARQTKLDRLVALKIIRPESADDPAFAERFNREARTLAKLNHPNIVAVHDFGEVMLSPASDEEVAPRSLYYFLMEYVDGANLRQLIQDDEYLPGVALEIIPQVCQALQFAHDEGVIHRDIKPENILVDTKGRAKIADFGLARLVVPTSQDNTLTGTHQVMGTPRYMAPEQMAGSHGVDHRADIYSLGVVFYEMLTGELPMGQFEPPSKKADVDIRLDKVVLRAMAREPERRFQQANEMQSSVEEVSSHSELPQDAGASTIVQREFLRTWRWIADDLGHTGRRPPQLPAVLMILMSVVGGLMFVLPWINLEIDKQTTTSDVFVELENAVARTFGGYETWSGITAATAFAALALLLAVTPTNERLTVWRSAVMTTIAALALLLTFLFRMELETRTYPVSFVALESDSQESAEPLFHSARLSSIEHRITYRPGFYGSLGLSIGLLVLTATGMRHAVGKSGESQSKDSRSADPPLTSLRFTVPIVQELGTQVVFHFTGLGYQLADEKPNVWVFQRGRMGGVWAGLCGTDIRELFTTLTVSTVPGKEGELLVNCVWAVRAIATWVEGRDVKKLQAEGRQLELLLGGGGDPTSGKSNWISPTRYSVAAIVGVVLSHLLIAVAVFSCVMVWQNRIWLARPIDWTPLLIYAFALAIVGVITTLVGLVSIIEIRISQGRVTGLGLAFAVSILFPTLLLDAVIFGLLHVCTASISAGSFLTPLLISLPVWLTADFLLIFFAWRGVSRVEDDISKIPLPNGKGHLRR